MKTKLIALLLTAAMVLCLSACAATSQKAASVSTAVENDTSLAALTEKKIYTYEFDGMAGKETAQFVLNSDGTCEFSLPDSKMITDIYAGSYKRDGESVSIVDLTNVDAASQHKTPGLWKWIVNSACTITVDDSTGTFTPSEAAGTTTASAAAVEAKTIKDVAYASVSPSQVCDIYMPNDVQKAPVIVLAHGGGFMFGDQRMDIIMPVIDAALANGYAVVSVDYRKASEAVFPAALADVKAAVRFVRANAAEYGFDAQHIAVWGESAGAYLSLMTALTPQVSELDGDVQDNSEVSSAVTALISFYAPVEFFTLYDEANQPKAAADSFESKFLGSDITADKTKTYSTYWETYADRLDKSIAAWVQAGDADSRVPYTQSVNFAQRLAGYIGEENVQLDILTGADHEDAQFYTQENLSKVFAWLDGKMKG